MLMFEKARVLLGANIGKDVGLMNGALGTLYAGVCSEGALNGSDLTWRRLLFLIVEFSDLHIHDGIGVTRACLLCEAGTARCVAVLRNQVISANELDI